MQLTGGSAKGRKLVVPKGQTTRPTPARVREAIFSMLVSVEEAVVLDPFAGGGTLSLEALSRGARHATCVERDAAALAALRQNLQIFGPQHSRIIATDAKRAISRLKREEARFDLVFLDPPYAQGALDTTLQSLIRGSLVGPGARVVCEHAPSSGPKAAGFTRTRERQYGDVAVTLLVWEDT